MVRPPQPAQRGRQIFEKGGERSRHGFGSSDDDVVAAGLAMLRQDFTSHRAQTAARPVADHGFADLPAGRETDPDKARGDGVRIGIGAAAHLDDHSG